MKIKVGLLGRGTSTSALGLLLVLMAFVFSSCAGDGAPAVEELGTTSAAAVIWKNAALTPKIATVVVGGTQQFKPETGTFAVSDPTIASVSAKGLLTAFAPGKVTVTRTVGTSVEKAAVTVVTAKLLAIDVTCGTASATKLGTSRVTAIFVGELLTCAVTGSYGVPGVAKAEKGTIPNASLTWTSSKPAWATVSASGVVQGIAAGGKGDVEILATDPATGIHGGVTFTVDSQPIVEITVTPAIASIPVSTTVQLKVTARRAPTWTRGGTTTPIDVVWSVADPRVASVDATGLVEGLAVGTTIVTATEQGSGIQATATLHVTPTTLTSIVIEAAKTLATTTKGAPLKGAPLPTEIGYEETIPLEAFGIYGAGTGTMRKPLDPAGTLWSSSDDSLATVSTGGVVTCVRLASGHVVITATDIATGKQGHVTFTVSPSALAKIEIASGKTSLTGLPAAIDLPLTLTAIFKDGKKALIKLDETAQAAWTSSDAKVAIISNLPGTPGVLTTVGDGSATITATFGGLTATANVTVVGTWKLLALDITAPTQRLPNGMTEQLVATGVFEEKGGKASKQVVHDVTDAVTWRSSSGAVSVSNAPGSKGRITALAPGLATITVEDPGSKVIGTATVLVTGAVVRSIAITPPKPTIGVKGSVQLEATATLSDGTVRDVTSMVVWTTTEPAVATVSNATQTAGLANGLAVGTTQIGAADPSSGVIAPDVLLTVNKVLLSKLAITPSIGSVANGLAQQFRTLGTYSDGTTKDLTASVVWTVTSGTATISNAASSSGLASSHGVGASTIEAGEATGFSATATLNVTAATLVSIAVAPALPSRALGLTVQLKATGTYTDGSTQDLTDGVAWTTSTSAASISNAAASPGLATTLAVGATVITATEGSAGIAGSTTLTVTAATLQSIAVAPLAASVPLGLTQTYVATGTFTDGSTQDLTNSVTWASTAPAIFALSNASDAGLGTALAVGSATLSATDPATLLAGSTTVTVTSAVLESIAVTAATSSLIVGATEQLSATGTYSDGSTADLTISATWACSDPTVVTVSSAGIATGIGAGSVTVTGTDRATGIAGSAQVTSGTTSCGESLTQCGGACVDETSDPNNCGSCGNHCTDPGASCTDGACAFPVSVTFVVQFACAEVSFDFDLIDDVDTVAVSDSLGTCATAPSCSGQCPSCGGTVTLPTALPAGSTYNITTTGSCTFSDGGGDTASGVVAGPVTLTATCIVDNC